MNNMDYWYIVWAPVFKLNANTDTMLADSRCFFSMFTLLVRISSLAPDTGASYFAGIWRTSPGIRNFNWKMMMARNEKSQDHFSNCSQSPNYCTVCSNLKVQLVSSHKDHECVQNIQWKSVEQLVRRVFKQSHMWGRTVSLMASCVSWGIGTRLQFDFGFAQQFFKDY